MKQGFAQRRKQLRKNLASHGFDWPALTAHLGVEETTRAEELSLEQWIALTNFTSGIQTGPAATLASRAQDVHGEIFDVVDEDDHVTGQASRHEVHARDLRHRAVHIFVFNRRGDLFLQKRSRWKDRHPQQWDSSAAGHVNAGDDYADTAPREIEEELGVRANARGDRLAAREPGDRLGIRAPLSRANTTGRLPSIPRRSRAAAFFTSHQIDRWIAARPQDFAPGFLACWRAFAALGGVAENVDRPEARPLIDSPV